MLDVEFFKRYPIVPSPRWGGAVALAFGAMERATRTRILFEDFVRPASPVMFATNSTQKCDFLIFVSSVGVRRARRCALRCTRVRP